MRRFVALALSSALVLQVAPLAAASGGQAASSTGVVSGTANSSTGQALAQHTVRLRNLDTGQLAGTTTSGANGSFTFAGLMPGNYAVEVVNQLGAIVGTSGSIAVVAGTTATVVVAATAVTAGVAAGGISTALIITTIAAAAGIAGVVVVVARDDASPAQ